MTCAKQFWKKMYTGWVMSIERQGNQGSTSPDTMCVVPYIAFCVTLPRLGQIYYDFDDSRTLQCTPILTCYMINCFWSFQHHFFHNAIALPVLKFIFKLIKSGRPTFLLENIAYERQNSVVSQWAYSPKVECARHFPALFTNIHKVNETYK